MLRKHWIGWISVLWCVMCAPLYAIDKDDCDAYLVVETYSGKPTHIYPSDAFNLPAGLTASGISIIQVPLHHAEPLQIEGAHIHYVPDSAYVGEDTLVAVVTTSAGVYQVFTRIIIDSAPATEGTEFWVGFMRNADEEKDDYTRELTKICVTAATFEDVDVRLRNPKTLWDTIAHLNAGEVKNLTIPRIQGYPDSCEIKEDKAIQVMSTSPITLYAVNYQRHSFDASNVLPVQSLGSEHMLQTYDGRGNSPAEYVIVGVEDGTRVEVRPNTSSSMHGFDHDTIIELNRGDFIQVKSATRDPFTATYIAAEEDKPIAIFAGNRCSFIPVGVFACDHLMEQVIPKYALGRDFVATSTYGRPIDYILITAVYDSTEVYTRGALHKVLMANETDTLTVGHWGITNLYIHTSKNVVAFLYQCGQFDEGTTQGGRSTDGDPSMVLLIPLEQRSYHSLFTTFKHERVYVHQYCNVVTPTATLDSMKLDGVCVKDQFRPVVGLDTMSYARMSLTHGIHLLENDAGGFIAHVCGESQMETYAYTVGSQFRDLRDTIIYLEDTICYNETYNFYGSILTKAGRYEEMEAEKDTVYILDLFVRPKPHEYVDTALICEGDVYPWHLNNYSIAGDYTDTIPDSLGCDSAVHLHLIVVTLERLDSDTSICPGDAFIWHGQTIDAEDTYTDTLRSVLGCDSIIYTKQVHFHPQTLDTVTRVSICENKDYTWHGVTYTRDTTVVDTLQNRYGCDSICTLVLTTRPITSSDTSITICDTELPFSWKDLQCTHAGDFQFDTLNTLQCDSTITLHLEVLSSTYYDTTAYVCRHDLPYEWHGQQVSVGPAQDILTNAIGCDSVITLSLVVLEPSGIDTMAAVYQYELPYTWRGQSLDHAGELVDTFTNAVGCDSTVTLHLTVYPDPVVSVEDTAICEGSSIIWHNQIISQAITYYDTLRSAIGVDLVRYQLHVSYKYASDSVTNATICEGETYPWHGQFYSTPVTVSEILVNSAGCDSVCTLNLQVRQRSTSETTEHICATSLPYSWNGVECTAGGNYTVHLTNSVDCDSAATLHLIVHDKIQTDTFVVLCPDDLPYSWHGQSLPSTGVYEDHFQSTWGCDSMVVCHILYGLSCRPGHPLDPTVPCDTAYSTIDTTILCTQTPFMWFGNPYSVSGTYHDTLWGASYHFCDSIGTLYLTVQDCPCEPTYASTDTTVCRSELPLLWEDSTWTDAGVKTKILSNAAGCDSVVTLTLNVNEASVGSNSKTVCRGELPLLWEDSTWTDAGVKTKILTNAAGCDSVVTLTLNVKEASVGSNSKTVCRGELPLLWEDSTWTDAGVKTKILSNAAGCDSVVTLTLNVKEASVGSNSKTICRGELPLLWEDSIWTEAGIKTKILTNAVGCDSVVTLTLSVKEASVGSNDTTICRGELPLLWEDSTWTDAGVKTKILTNAAGCDSVVTLTLSVNEASVGGNSKTVCRGELPLLWEDSTWTDAGVKTKILMNAAGCDSVVTLTLNVKEASVGSNSKTICRGELPLLWEDSTWTDAGVKTKILSNAAGCDSIVTLTLNVKEPTTGDTTAYVCAGTDFYWHGAVALDGAQLTLTNAAGCDSVVTLHLITRPVYHQDVNLTVCDKQIPYTWNGIVCPQAGDYVLNSVTAAGCDSVVTLHLAVDVFSASDTAAAICRADLPYTWHGKQLHDAGTLKDTLVNSVLCDSIVTLTLTVNEPTTGDTTAYVCASTDFYWHGAVALDGAQLTLTNAAGCDSVVTLHIITKPGSSFAKDTTVCAEALPLVWADSTWTEAGTKTAILTNAAGCDSMVTLTLHVIGTCCSLMEATMTVPDVCADDPSMDVTVTMQRGAFTSYSVHYTNAPGNTMPFRDTVVNDAPADQSVPVTLTLPVPHDTFDRTRYPRPDTYGMTMTLYNACGDSLRLASDTFDVLFPSWILDQHWDDVIAVLNDRYNGGYTFSDIKWFRDGDVLEGEKEMYIYLPHQLWTTPDEQYHPYWYQALLTRTDDGKSIMTCPMIPYHIDSTNILTQPYVAVTPTFVPHENPVVHVMTNTEGTYWLYDAVGKLLHTADYEPCVHDVFDIQLYGAQAMYILVFTPRNESKPLQKKYRVFKVLVY